jgi:hypothetical protein
MKTDGSTHKATIQKKSFKAWVISAGLSGRKDVTESTTPGKMKVHTPAAADANCIWWIRYGRLGMRRIWFEIAEEKGK